MQIWTQRLLFFILCLGLQTAWAWSPIPKLAEIKKLPPKEIQFRAEGFYANKDYVKAHYYYLALSQVKKRLNPEEQYRLGKTAVEAGNYDLAIATLEPMLKKSSSRYPLLSFELGKAHKFKGEYDKSMSYFEAYLQKHKQDGPANPHIMLSKRHIEACQKALKAQSMAQFAIASAGSNLESEVGVMRGLTNPGLKGWRLVEFEDDKGVCLKKVSTDMEVLPLASSAGNPLLNNSSPHIAPDGQTVYFARLEKTKTGGREYKIYTGQLTEAGEIEDIKRLSSAVNPDGSSSFYPSLALTPQGQEILYFSSNMPGGEGGFDIWYSVRMTNGEFTRPYNLGMRINSPNDEITPYYHAETGELYFSSDKPESFGGFDIYKMIGEKRRWEGQGAEQLPFPLNSHGNDTHFILDENGEGTFNTDRDGGKSQPLRFQDIRSLSPDRP